MYYTGFADEAAATLEGQIKATKTLGWKYIESRTIDGVNIHDLPEDKFEEAAAKLEEAGVMVNCFGSAVANWGWSPLDDQDFQATTEQLKRAIKRMKKLNCKMIRGMSFKAQWSRPAWDKEIEDNVFRKVNALVRMCEEADILYLHENCNNYGGMSWKHTLKLLDQIKSPNFKLVFDTGNPVINFDRSQGDELNERQSSWEFYRNVREFIHYVHIKDAIFKKRSIDGGFNQVVFTFAGEGEGDVVHIVTDLLRRGYDGGFSMEPHMKKVFHEVNSEQNAMECMTNYVEYGKRFMKMVENIKNSLAE